MELVLYGIAILLYLVGLIGIVAPGIPGGVLLAIAVVVAAWAENFTRIGVPSIVFAIGAAVVISALDYVAALLGAKLGGGTRWGLLGASLGLLVGFFLGPLGIVLGPVAGAAIFEYWKDPDARKALKAGAGVAVGFFVGTALKLALAFVLLGFVLVDWLR